LVLSNPCPLQSCVVGVGHDPDAFTSVRCSNG
jgi:hypothetical protein